MPASLARPTLFALCLFTVAQADELPAQADAIRVSGGRNAVAQPYQRAYEIAKGVADATQGRIVLGMRLAPARPDVDMRDLRLTISTDTEDLPLPLEGGVYTPIPAVERLARDNGQFYLNRKSQDISVHILLLPSKPEAPWNLSRVRQTLADAKPALSTVVPWYARLFIGNAKYVGLCAASQQASITLQSAGQTVASFPVDTPKTSHLGKPVYCKGFTGKEEYDDTQQLVLPADGEVLLY